MVVLEDEVYKCDNCEDTIVVMDEYMTHFQKPVTRETTYLHEIYVTPGYGSGYDTLEITLHFCEECLEEFMSIDSITHDPLAPLIDTEEIYSNLKEKAK